MERLTVKEELSELLSTIDDPSTLFGGLFLGAPIPYAIFRADGRCVATNRAFADFFGMTPAPEYNLFESAIVRERGLEAPIRSAFAGNTERIPVLWYDPSSVEPGLTTPKKLAIALTMVPLRNSAGEVANIAFAYRDVTPELTRERERDELRALSEAIRVQEEELRATLFSIGDGVVSTDTNGAVVRMNAVAEQLTGWSTAEAVGKPLDDVFRIVHQTSREPVENPVARVLAEGMVVGLANHTALLARDGKEYAIADSAAPIRGAAGDLKGVVLVFRDVTKEYALERERRQNEERLRRSEVRIGLMLKAARMIAWEADPATGAVKVAGDSMEILGLLKPMTHVNDALALLDEPTRAKIQTSYDRPKEPLELVFRATRPDNGQTIWLERRGHQLQREDGTLDALVGVTVDVTARHLAEESERSKERRFQKIIEQSPEIMSLHALDGSTIFVSPSIERVLGYKVDEYLAISFGDLIHPGDIGEAVGKRKRLMEFPETTQTSEMRVRHRDGTWRHILFASINLLGDPDVGAIVAHGRDITDRKKAEEIRARAAELEQLNRRIEEATRLKSEFLANMSHELRTPLNAIIGFAELLHDGKVDPATPTHKEFLGDILASGKHLLQLINDVLDLAKVEAGKLDFRPQKLRLSTVVTEVVAILRTTAAEQRIFIETEVDPAVEELTLDSGRLKQVLYNYLSNALKFTPMGGRVILRALPLGEHSVRIEVEDSGIGVAPQDIGKLFTEFQQLAGGASKRYPGTGLGLALTKRLVEAQGGSVGVRSTVDVGSTFYVHLPRISDAFSTSTPVLTRSVAPGSKVVLVVEDEPREQAYLAGLLAQSGYSVEIASTGAEAIRRAGERTYDAITLDLLLPDTNGIELLAGIRASGRNASTPVVVVTVVSDARVTSGVTVHDVLLKPVQSATLLATLERAAKGEMGSSSPGTRGNS